MARTQLENSKCWYFNAKYFQFCYSKVWQIPRVLGSDVGTTIITQQNVSSLISGRELVLT